MKRHCSFKLWEVLGRSFTVAATGLAFSLFAPLETHAATPAQIAMYEQQLAGKKRELAKGMVKQAEVDELEALIKRLKGGSGGSGGGSSSQPDPKRKPPTRVLPDPKNPWSLPGAMWSQKSDGSYEYYRLEKDKSGRNKTIVVEPHVLKDGRVSWTDKK